MNQDPGLIDYDKAADYLQERKLKHGPYRVYGYMKNGAEIISGTGNLLSVNPEKVESCCVVAAVVLSNKTSRPQVALVKNFLTGVLNSIKGHPMGGIFNWSDERATKDEAIELLRAAGRRQRGETA